MAAIAAESLTPAGSISLALWRHWQFAFCGRQTAVLQNVEIVVVTAQNSRKLRGSSVTYRGKTPETCNYATLITKIEKMAATMADLLSELLWAKKRQIVCPSVSHFLYFCF